MPTTPSLRAALAVVATFVLACSLGSQAPPPVEDAPVAEAGEPAPRAKARPRAGAGPRARRSAAESADEEVAPEEGEPGPASTEPDTPAKDTTTAGSDAQPAGIRDLGNRTWSVERRLVKKWEDNPGRFAKANEKGKGWVLKGVDSRAARHLGFESGDVVLSVNGHSLATKAEALKTYGLVRNKKTLVVVFKRGGERRTHTVKVTGG